MARQLFVSLKDNQELSGFIEDILYVRADIFKEKLTGFLLEKIKTKLEGCADSDFLNSLYFLGSFSRGLGGEGSDLDLVSFSKDVKALESFNLKVREVFKSYSLKTVASLEDYVEQSDPKGLLSGWFIKPVFAAPEVVLDLRAKTLEKREEEILDFLESETESRKKRYGKRPGRIHFNIKYSPGGWVDLRQRDFLSTDQVDKANLIEVENFLYKIRSLNHFFAKSDSLQVALVKNYRKYFGFSSDREFYKIFFKMVNKVFNELGSLKKSFKAEGVPVLLKNYGLEFSEVEFKDLQALLKDIEGLVLAPSYHTWTAAEHTLKCVEEASLLIADYEKEFELTAFEKQVLLWAAFFHDIKKGKEESHSILGSKAVQEFGKEHSWDSKKTELVSWLVREHLSLVRYSFKADPFEPEFVKNLSLKGCVGRRAVLLFLLSCADLKATNSASWSEWKKRMLKQSLGQILGEEDKLKKDLVTYLPKGGKGFELAELLRLKEICFVPFELLKEDLLNLKTEGFAFYELDGKTWVRCYQEQDEARYAKRFLECLSFSGAYVHHALFKTLDHGIYNWVCVETGVSVRAFEKRFLTTVSQYDHKRSLFEEKPNYSFDRIRLTFLKSSYAVLSFKGEDQRGALFEALRVLAAHKLNIEWGHAVTWGDEIEDVFGVSFTTEPDWSFVT